MGMLPQEKTEVDPAHSQETKPYDIKKQVCYIFFFADKHN